jgi:hypothetical protein
MRKGEPVNDGAVQARDDAMPERLSADAQDAPRSNRRSNGPRIKPQDGAQGRSASRSARRMPMLAARARRRNGNCCNGRSRNLDLKEDNMSTLDPDNDLPQPGVPGTDTGALGPGDSSDSGSDIAGAKRHDFDRDTELDNHALETGEIEESSDTDRTGTGERASADGDETLTPDADVLPDRIDSFPSADDVTEDDEVDELRRRGL